MEGVELYVDTMEKRNLKSLGGGDKKKIRGRDRRSLACFASRYLQIPLWAAQEDQRLKGKEGRRLARTTFWGVHSSAGGGGKKKRELRNKTPDEEKKSAFVGRHHARKTTPKKDSWKGED